MGRKFFLFAVCFFSLLLIAPDKANASHSMGVDLTYICLGNGNYAITISFYRDCSGISAPGSANVNIGSSCFGSQTLTLPLISSQEISALCPTALSTCQGGGQPGTEQYIYSDTVNLGPCSNWTFSWTECCRNAAITNLLNPSSQDIYIKATLDNTGPDCNSSPIFTTLPVPYICNGQPYNYNHGAIDADGDSLVYSLTNPLTGGGVAIGYQPGYSPTYPISTQSGVVNFSSTTGQMFITPNMTQIAVVTVLVQEYRNGVLIGSTMRDIQIIVLNCGNLQPQLNPPGIVNLNGGTLIDTNSVEVCVGSALTYNVVASDPDIGDIITMTSNANLALSGATFTAAGNNPVTGTLSWTPGFNDLGFNFYTVTIQDNGCPVLGTQLYVFEIKVITGTYAGPDVFLCDGDTAQLSVGGGTSFLWTPSTNLSSDTISNPLAYPATTTTYTVTSDLSGSCGNSDNVIVNVVPDFTLSTGPGLILCDGGSAQLNATATPAGNYTYQWSPSSSLNFDTVPNPLATPTVSTLYTVSVSAPSGCTKTWFQMVTVSPTPLASQPTIDDEIVCLGSSTGLHANVGMGNCNAYAVTNIPFAPIPGSGTVVTLGDDAVSPALSIGFSFMFFCSAYNSFYLSSNGLMSFSSGQGNGCCSGQVIPNAAIPNNVIGFAWEDLNPPGGGSINYFTSGVTPNRILVMNFNGIPHFGSPNLVTTQVLLYEGTNFIEIHTTSMQSDGGSHTMGIENSNGTIGFPAPGRNSTNWSASNEGIRFTPLVPPPFTISWFDPDSNLVGTSQDITIAPVTSGSYSIVITDGACTDTKAVNVLVSTAYAGPDTGMCLGDSVQLSAVYMGPTGASAPDVCGLSLGCNGSGTGYTVGTGSSTNTSTSYPAVYGNWYKNAKHQILYTVADLLAAGVTPGTITHIGFFVNTINGTNLYKSFELKLGCTTASSLTTWISGLTTVFTPKNVTITTGLNQYTLDSPYDWDGISNLVLETCFNNLPDPSYTNNSASPYSVTGYTSVLYYISDVTVACPYTGIASTSPNRPNTQFTVCTDSITPVFSWTPVTGLSDSSVANPIAAPLVPTQYIVTVDNGICIVSDTITVTPSTLNMATSTISASCSGLCNGTATVTPNGLAPYTYLWNDADSQVTQTATGLCSGIYMISVTDASGCIGTMMDTVPDGSILTPAVVNVFNSTCSGICNGQATMSVSGGTSPYSFLWSDGLGQTGQTVIGLCAGVYSVTITDINGCFVIDSITITEPSNLTTSTNVSCLGACNGLAAVTAVGGLPPYTYFWNDSASQTTAIATGLCAGTYISSVVDSNGCSAMDTVIVSAPYTMISGTVCSDNSCSGSVTVTPVGGTPPFTYLWSDPSAQSDPVATGLCPGTYTVQVFDSSSCMMNDTAVIPLPLITAITDSVNVSCAGICDGSAAVAVVGGASPFTFLWNDLLLQSDSNATALCAGTYVVQVTDANNCIDTSTVSIVAPSALVVQTSATCFGVCDGNATVIPNGGTSPYTFLWNDPAQQTTGIATGLCSGSYMITVTDANGCIISDSASIAAPSSQMDIVNATCQGLCDGQATVTPVGGVAPFSYLWGDPASQTGATAIGLCVGILQVTITDSTGCLIFGSASVNENSPLGIYQSVLLDASCNGYCDGSASLTASEGSPPYTYQWNDPAAQTGSFAYNLCAGVYTMSLSDADGCLAIDTVTINEPAPLLSVMDNPMPVKCSGQCDGSATVTASGGTYPYSYQWDDPLFQTNLIALGLCGGYYNLIVTDANSCVTKDSVFIDAPLKLTAVTDTTMLNCVYDCDGYIIATPSGGWPPYSYSWNDPNLQTTSTATGLCLGGYIVKIMDSSGCETVALDTISAIPAPELSAEFSATPVITTIFSTTVNFTDLSIGYSEIEWNFGDGYAKNQVENPSHTYNDLEPGVYNAWLIVTNNLGCKDSVMKVILIEGDYTLFAPYAFTPNGDGLNETFFPKGFGLDESNFKFYIFNRWGDLIYKTDDINKPWDGRANDGERAAQNGVYVWLIKALDVNGVEHKYIGRVTLLH